MGGCLIAFANKFKNVPIIGMTAFNDNFRVNSLSKHAIVPALSAYSFYNHIPITFLGRTFNFLLHIADKISVHHYAIPKMTAIIKESTSFKDSPSMLELGTRSVLFMTNYDPCVDGIQQLPPNVIPGSYTQHFTNKKNIYGNKFGLCYSSRRTTNQVVS